MKNISPRPFSLFATLRHFAVVASIVLTSVTSTRAEAKSLEGTSFPEFVAAPFPGAAKVDSKSISSGKAVIVDFWASWCEPCKIELPALNALYKKYKSAGLIIVGVNVDDDVKDAKAFLKDHPVAFPLAFDKGKKMVEGLEISTMPTSFIVSNGKIVKMHSGFRDGDAGKIEKEIKKLLAH